ncbi:MAG TPA: glyoxylate/hydroxypyruvate reductase A, partial [Rhizobiaceae bacterium]|nr:glyoxylate/hydroxypyruvate reductase A [Rhizobiaceae bacterium]
MTILIDIRDDSPGNWLPAFTEALPQERAIWAADASESDLASAEWVLVWSPDPQRMRAMTGLKAIFSMGAGVDHVFALGEALPNAPVVRFVDPDLTNRMSEWVVLQCLTHLRQVRAYQALQHAH